eukprot:12987857-Alexandrium_andersonii.AAC.1
MTSIQSPRKLRALGVSAWGGLDESPWAPGALLGWCLSPTLLLELKYSPPPKAAGHISRNGLKRRN